MRQALAGTLECILSVHSKVQVFSSLIPSSGRNTDASIYVYLHNRFKKCFVRIHTAFLS